MPDSIEIIDIETLEPLERGSVEWRFYCPACPEKRGKEDDDGKFYWNTVKQKGYCFKCSTAFYPESDGPENEHEKELQRVAEQWNMMQDPMLMFENLDEPQGVPFEFPDLDDDDIAYLKKRNPFLVPLRKKLDIHGWHGQDRGVVMPFYYRDIIVKFQTRFYTRKDWKRGKYYTANGPKPVYSPRRVLNNFRLKGDDQITICEGVYDAIALDIMGYHNPLALLGDKLTPLQAYIIRNLCPYRAVVSLDDWDRCLSIKKVLHKLIPSLQEVHIECKWGKYKDPEEFLVGEIRRSKDFALQCKDRVVEWVKST